MRYFIEFTFLFAMGSMVGWLIELFYRRFFGHKDKDGKRKWINPGFLVGPCLPLYGFCSCLLYLLSSAESYIPIKNDILRNIVMLIVMAAFITLIEYIAGLIFIKKMKIKLWDYSKNKGNIGGIICPLFSFFWTILGAIYYFAIYPYVLSSVEWLYENLAFSFFVGAFFGVFILDFVYSANLMVKIKKFAEEKEIVVVFEELRNNIKAMATEKIKKPRFFSGFSGQAVVNEHLKNYYQKLINIKK